MKTTVKIVQACGDFRAGDVVTIDATQAQRLLRTGYARLPETPEDGAAATRETTEQARPRPRSPRTERRG